jgi:hypothetical protein
MRTLGFNRYALSVSVAAIMFAGCGGVTQFPNPVAQTSLGGAGTGFRVASPDFATPQRVGPNSSGAEVLSGTAKVRSGRCRKSSGSYTHFSAHGKATGPYPGTFTAGGRWAESCLSRVCGWSFNEKFTIKSGVSKVLGTIKGTGGEGWFPTCTSFGPEPYYYVQYESKYGSGTVSIESIQNGVFDESLNGL